VGSRACHRREPHVLKCNGEQPTLTTSRRRSDKEATRLTPHIEKNLAQEVLGKRLIADEPKKPAVDVGPMPGEQRLHRWFAASGDLFNQDLV